MSDDLDGPCPSCGRKKSLKFRRSRDWKAGSVPRKGDTREHWCIGQNCSWRSNAVYNGHDWVWDVPSAKRRGARA